MSDTLSEIRRFALVAACAAAWGCASAPRAPDGPAGGPGSGVVEEFDAALAALDADEPALAEDMLLALAAAHPDLPGPRINLAIHYARTGRRDEARALLETLVAAHPDQPVAWTQLGVLLRKDGRLEEAESAYRRALEADPGHALAHRNLGVLMDLYLGRPEEAVGHYQRYLELAGGDAEVERWVEELELRLGLGRTSRVAGR